MSDRLADRHHDAASSSGARPPGVANRKPSGRACSNCAQLKMKCQWPAGGPDRPDSICTRCARMGVLCHVPESAPRGRRGKSTRVAQLEKKIDGIVSLLASGQHMQANGTSPSESIHLAQPVPPIALDTQDGRGNGALSVDAATDMPTFELIPGLRITSAQASSHLKAYRNDFMLKFPFVLIPHNMNPYTLHEESPSLFWMVMAAVAPQSAEVQKAVKKWFRQHIAEQVVVKQERRLDLLQAILIHLAWGDFQYYFDMQSTNFIQLAMALVIDLKLDRAPGSLYGAPRTLLGDAWSNIGKASPFCNNHRTSHTLDDKRALLGLYHITSLRVPHVQWNNYLSQCCDSLIETRDCDSDLYIAVMVRMERATERVHSIMPGPDFSEGGTTVFRSTHDMAIGVIRREVEDIFNSQPQEIQQNKLLRTSFHILLMRLYEPVISMRPPSFSDPDAASGDPFQRSEALWKCLQAGIDFFDTQLSIPAGETPSLPFTSTGTLAFAIITTSRLMLLDSSGDWQPAVARRKLDFADIVKRMSRQFEEGERHAESLGRRQRLMDDGSSLFYRYALKLRWIRQWYLSRVPLEPQQHQQPPPVDARAVEVPSPSADLGQMGDFNLDEGFWEELMSMHDPNLLALPSHGPLQHQV